MKDIHKKRFINLIRAVEEGIIPKDEERFKMKEFNMEGYGYACGSPACVLGHYAYRTDLQSEFYLDVVAGDHKENWLPAVVRSVKDSGVCTLNGIAVCKHFGLNLCEAVRLFDGGGCGGARTRREAVTYIKGFLLGKGVTVL